MNVLLFFLYIRKFAQKIKINTRSHTNARTYVYTYTYITPCICRVSCSFFYCYFSQIYVLDVFNNKNKQKSPILYWVYKKLVSLYTHLY